MDAARESRYAYWNALLTLNGIFITVFSAIAFIAQQNKWYIFVLVACSLLSSGLLVMNFVATKELYKKLGQMDSEAFDKLTDDQRKADIEESSSQHQWLENRETIVQGLLFVEATIIILLFLV